MRVASLGATRISTTPPLRSSSAAPPNDVAVIRGNHFDPAKFQIYAPAVSVRQTTVVPSADISMPVTKPPPPMETAFHVPAARAGAAPCGNHPPSPTARAAALTVPRSLRRVRFMATSSPMLTEVQCSYMCHPRSRHMRVRRQHKDGTQRHRYH